MEKYLINLISDTVTKPTQGMREAMMNAEVGDDVFREDPTVIALEERLAQMFNHEAGLFCPSGTMTNQIAIKGHTKPLDEMICDINSHVYQFEVGGYAFHSQIAVNPIIGEHGILFPEMIRENIKAKFDWLPRTKLLVVENSSNRTGGNCYTLQQLIDLAEVCKEEHLAFHLDGARIFNALIASQIKANDVGPLFDSISICLSKGLGTPMGSVLIGKKTFIDECRRIRKVMGGGMRQTGIIAAAGLYALDHHIIRLEEDHQKAKQIEKILSRQSYVESIYSVETNIVIFKLIKEIKPQDFVEKLRAKGVNSSAFGKQSIRLVTHMDISLEMLNEFEFILDKFHM